MLNWRQLPFLSNEDLGKLGIAEMNLACMIGLPDADRFRHYEVLVTLDSWARRVQLYTQQHFAQFQRKPQEFKDSEAYFRAMVMITVLQRDLGMKYNPAKIPHESQHDTNDVFITGPVCGDGGTCCSLPVIVVAIARWLGYPVYLVHARAGEYGHSYARWESPTDRFNIEAAGKGFNDPPDEYYWTGKYAVTEKQIEVLHLFKALTPREELGTFLMHRGHQWRQYGSLRQAVESFAWSYACEPHIRGTHNTLGRHLHEWHDKTEARKPAGFPPLYWSPWPHPRIFPETLAESIERDIQMTTSDEMLLDNPEYEQRWWGPMRRGVRPGDVPTYFEGTFQAASCTLIPRYGSVGRWVTPTGVKYV